jgi:hypothetical protein
VGVKGIPGAGENSRNREYRHKKPEQGVFMRFFFHGFPEIHADLHPRRMRKIPDVIQVNSILLCANVSNPPAYFDKLSTSRWWIAVAEIIIYAKSVDNLYIVAKAGTCI